MKINKEKIKELKSLAMKSHEAKEKEGELAKVAKENRDVVHVINRDGKAVDLTEGDLWEEVRHIGLDSEAGKILEEKYPDVFVAARERDRIGGEFADLVVKDFGVLNYPMLSVTDIVLITDAMIKDALSEYADNK